MKKLPLFLALAFAAFLALPAAGSDFGLTITDTSTYSHQDVGSWQQVNQALAWFSRPIGSRSDLYVSGFYEFKGTYYSDSSDVKPWRIDAGRVELAGSSPALFGPSSAFRYSLGRIATGDFSTLVLAGLSDGTRLEADFGNASFYLTGGYRGLLYKNDAYSHMNANDAELNADDDRYLAPARAFAGIGARLAELVKKHDLGIEFFSQFDCSDSSEKIHTQYFEPYIEGKLSRLLSWQAWGIFETAESPDLSSSLAAGEMLRLSMPELAGFKLTQTAHWASGSTGSLSAFVPIRAASIDATSFFTFTDLLKIKLDASLMPLNHLVVDLALAGYFRNATVDPENQAQLRSDAGYFRGTELSASASSKLSSDLSLNLSTGVFIPDTATAYPDGTPPRYMAELYAAFDL
jgi:hypothetical protein